MDREEIRYLLGSTIYARAKAYENRVQDLECETAENGVRHLSADVRGSGRNLYRTQAWLRQNGSFVSASCTCRRRTDHLYDRSAGTSEEC